MNVKKLSNILLIVLIFVVITSGVSLYFLWKSTNELSRKAYERQYIADTFSAKIFALESLQRNYKKYSENLDGVLSALPKDKDASGLLTEVEKMAEKRGAKIRVYKYTELTEKSKKSKKKETVKDLNLSQTVKKNDFFEVSYHLTVDGSYINAMLFLKEVENSERLVVLKNVSISKLNEGENGPNDSVTLNFDLSAYLKQ